MRFFCFPFRCQKQRSHESMFRLASFRLVAAMGVTSPSRLNPVIRRMRYVLPQQLAAVRFNSSTANSDDEFSFDSTELIQREAALTNLSSNTEKLIQQFLPPNAPESARSKVAKYLRDHPIDQLIVCPTVQVTHIEDEAGEEKKAGNLSPMSVKEAMEAAHARGFVVVQMGEANGKAFVRLRNEKKRILAIIAEDLAAAGSSVSDQAAEPEEQLRLKKSVDHIFRDVVDAHFISWKSKKIVEDLKKMHPVKVGIQQFQSAESAIAKLREMCVAMKGHAETGNVIHHFTSVNASDREIAVLFSPSAQGRENSAKSIKHPGEKEWNNALSRLQGQLRKSGRAGTYTKHDVLKARNLGAVTYRVDRFGRRMM